MFLVMVLTSSSFAQISFDLLFAKKKMCLLPEADPLLSLFMCIWCEPDFVVVSVSFLLMQAEETEFQQASDGNPE